MAKRGKLDELQKAGWDLEKTIPAMVNSGGQKRAADELGVTQASISNWLKKQGYTQIIRYVKSEKVKAQ